MVVKRGLAAQGCYQCRSAVLKLFTVPLSSAPFSKTAGPFIYRPRIVAPTFTRSFSSPAKETKSLGDQYESEQDLEYESGAKDEGGDTLLPEDTSTADVPWYLQVEPPRHVATIEPPPLPEVPEGSPAVVGSLLEYVSEELGLDELSLLDLREIDPPPALGPNLFMLFGTARSERHLHVSAGRLVRWLRYKHRIYADADGLLGPNERKKKLKRKAKRAKLLGTMGTEDHDDGIRTGWICVNLGTIGRGGGESTVVAEDGRFAGFGVAQSGSTIVIQIMLESRRAELNLETLWKKTLDPPIVDESQPPRIQKEPSEPKKQRLANLHPLEKAMLSSSPSRPVSRNTRAKDPSLGQASFYSTMSAEPSAVNEADPLRSSSIEDISRVLTYDAGQKIRLLELLRARLHELSPLDACRALGYSQQTTTRATTPFLQLFELACKHPPRSQTWEFRLAALSRSDFVPIADARALSDEMRISRISATRDQHLQLLRCILISSDSSSSSSEERFSLALDLMRTMQQRGQGLMANDVIATLIEGRMARPTLSPVDHAVQNLRQLAAAANLSCMDEPTLMRLMTVYARRDFWGICTLVARQCFQEMIAENPPVRPVAGSEVRQALLDCIHVADPQAQRIARTTPANAKGIGATLANREFVKLIHVIESMG